MHTSQDIKYIHTYITRYWIYTSQYTEQTIQDLQIFEYQSQSYPIYNVLHAINKQVMDYHIFLIDLNDTKQM